MTNTANIAANNPLVRAGPANAKYTIVTFGSWGSGRLCPKAWTRPPIHQTTIQTVKATAALTIGQPPSPVLRQHQVHAFQQQAVLGPPGIETQRAQLLVTFGVQAHGRGDQLSPRRGRRVGDRNANNNALLTPHCRAWIVRRVEMIKIGAKLARYAR